MYRGRNWESFKSESRSWFKSWQRSKWSVLRASMLHDGPNREYENETRGRTAKERVEETKREVKMRRRKTGRRIGEEG
jgi:hypothetical protein